MTNNPFAWLDNFLGPLNLIDHARGEFGKLVHGKSVRIELLRLHAGGKWTRRDARAALMASGVPTYGHTHDGNHIYFWVPERDIDTAMDVLGLEVHA